MGSYFILMKCTDLLIGMVELTLSQNLKAQQPVKQQGLFINDSLRICFSLLIFVKANRPEIKSEI